MPFIKATVTAEPSLLESIGYPASLPAARSLSEAPGLEGSQFTSQLTGLLADETNLGRAEAVAWLKLYLLGEYSERVVAQQATLVEVLAIDIHVPDVPGATAELELSSETSESVRFDISVFGSGGGRTQHVRFQSQDVTKANDCTRICYSSMGVLQLVEMVNGPDAGRRFVRLHELGEEIVYTETTDIDSSHCQELARGPGAGRAVFDLRKGAVEKKKETLTIETMDEWHIDAGVTFPNAGISSKLSSQVVRSQAISTSYTLPPGRSYEAYRASPSPCWQWTLPR
jgi:hypothetical protein